MHRHNASGYWVLNKHIYICLPLDDNSLITLLNFGCEWLMINDYNFAKKKTKKKATDLLTPDSVIFSSSPRNCAWACAHLVHPIPVMPLHLFRQHHFNRRNVHGHLTTINKSCVHVVQLKLYDDTLSSTGEFIEYMCLSLCLCVPPPLDNQRLCVYVCNLAVQ